MAKEKPSYKNMFLYRQNLKLDPSQNFVDKFKEYYMELIVKVRCHENDTIIDDNTAKFYIVSVLESIIYCLDFGIDVWLSRLMVFTQKKTDYRHNVKSHRLKVVENVKKIAIRPIDSLIRKIKKIINKDNQEYNQHLENKRNSYNEIKQYYKEFYGKEDEWWQGPR